MFCKRLFGILLMYLIILGKNIGISEWVELPQFSDDKKIYRGTFGKYDRDKLIDEGYINAKLYAFPNSTSNHFNVKDISTVVNNFKIDKTSTSLTTIIYDNYDNKNNTTIKVSSELSDDDDGGDTVVTEENEDLEIDTEYINTSEETNDTGSDKFLQYNSTNVEEIPASILKIISNINKEKKPSSKPENKQTSFWDYLPIEFFKNIHKNLMAYQSRSADVKYEVLKTFKSSLLNEIELRLVPIVNPVRKKRGSEWEESDSQVGFPSLEGALMAISFLTFAVYLVQLVMTLFKYLATNNQAAQPAPATFVVNRSKRSPIDLPDESLRILEYLDKISNHNIHYQNNL